MPGVVRRARDAHHKMERLRDTWYMRIFVSQCVSGYLKRKKIARRRVGVRVWKLSMDHATKGKHDASRDMRHPD